MRSITTTSPRLLAAVVASTAVALTVGAALLAAPAGADPAGPTPTGADTAGAAPAVVTSSSTTSSTVTQDALPTAQVNGVVWGETTVGNTVYAVGKFTSARPAGAASGTHLVARPNIVAYDIRTGVLTSFVHSLNAQALAVTASPDSATLYVGGQFTQVDGHNRYRIAAFSTATGALLPYAPAPNASVLTIAATSSTVYFGGGFSQVSGNSRLRLAATTPTGALLGWAPSATADVRAIAPAPGGSKVYVGGSFSSVNGQATEGVSAVDPTTGASIPVPVSSQIIATSNNSTGAGIYSLRSDGHLIYGGAYNAVSAKFPQLEGTFAIDPASGQTVWVNDCWGDTYQAVPINGALYVASHAHDCSAAHFFPQNGSNHYYGLAYGLSASSAYNVADARGWDYSHYHTSTLVQWNPTFAQGSIAGQSVWCFTGNSSYVVAGGEFPQVNRVAQQGLVRFAVHSLAPNVYGPSQIGTASAAQVGRTSVVTVKATSAYDPDDGTLTYQLIRDGDTAHPVATTTAPTVGFWAIASRPAITLTDPHATVGTHRYALRAVDGGGKTVTGGAATATVVG